MRAAINPEVDQDLGVTSGGATPPVPTPPGPTPPGPIDEAAAANPPALARNLIQAGVSRRPATD